MAKNDAPEEKTSRLKQIVSAYKLTQKSEPLVGLVLAGIFLGIVALAVLGGFLVGPLLVWIPLGVALGFLAATIVFGRKVEKAAYSQIEGQAGAAASALQTLRRGWSVDPAVAVTKNSDIVHRVVGKPGIILVGEGQPSRVKNLLAAEAKKHNRVAGGAPVTQIVAGKGEGEIDIRKLTKYVMKLPAVLQPSEITDLLQRLKALDAVRPQVPMPKGPVPTSLKGARQAMRGR
ncbi:MULTISPECIES: DUF4191 domain-containing protein [Kribbella]|jgi:hypothetical protein|uniref:Uncharacterized protein DUF4191 n=1 Tax=Kribbella pratensis TaxID=2512112 RepID=A0ABY2FMG2_9ACTN|nr:MULTISPECIES: DUF4191 domain-containing protein [Kribbella]TDO69617.1 uncharacterized protein DUF4191 [Kribbella sp. VKM Ac-2571]TDW94303.1 uncharacterized protein DUF4191 [Kribbella pratensis]TDX02908.1 uncharacterized protein DUF4191 [Kribbella sp. VKM Ac-2566]